MAVFVALRVWVGKDETNRAALHRTLRDCRIALPTFIPTPGSDWGVLVDSPEQIPDKDFKVGDDYLVKFEAAN